MALTNRFVAALMHGFQLHGIPHDFVASEMTIDDRQQNHVQVWRSLIQMSDSRDDRDASKEGLNPIKEVFKAVTVVDATTLW